MKDKTENLPVDLIEILRWFPGKSSKNSDGSWLPLLQHLRDTSGIAEKLWDEWVPGSVKDCIASGSSLDKKSSFAFEEMGRLCKFLAFSHDIGKLTKSFVLRISGFLPLQYEKFSGAGLDLSKVLNNPYYPHHSLASEIILVEFGASPGVASVVGAHHGKPQSDPDGCGIVFKNETQKSNFWGSQEHIYKAAWILILHEALTFCGYLSVSDGFCCNVNSEVYRNLGKIEELVRNAIDALPVIDKNAQVLLTAIIEMSDWIASNEHYFPLLPEDKFIAAEGRVERAWSKIEFPSFWRGDFGYKRYNKDIFENEFGFEPNFLQDEVIKLANGIEQPGIFIIEAPMGAGKTEAALAAAEIFRSKVGAGGLFFGLPTQATANGLFVRISKWAEYQSGNTEEERILNISLLHGSAELNEDYAAFEGGNSLVVHDWFSGKKQALLSNFAVGTVDQFLMAALKQKYFMLRMLGLASKVIVIDECHAYDAYMNCYMDRVIRWMGAYGTPVIILSATLPAKRREELVLAYLGRKSFYANTDYKWHISRDYPLITYTDGSDICQRQINWAEVQRKVAVVRIPAKDIMGMLCKYLKDGGCAGIIFNSVKKAQKFAKALQNDFPEAETILIHSYFTAQDRRDIETEILRRLGKKSGINDRNKLIVVGTQILEQSLDIDFDVMFTELCPMDLLLQRIGRLHRHKQRDKERPEVLKKAKCFVVFNDDGKMDAASTKIYGSWLLFRTDAKLPASIDLPASIPCLIQDVYSEVIDCQPENISDIDYQRAKEIYVNKLSNMSSKADVFRLGEPSESGGSNLYFGSVMTGMLDGVNFDIGDKRAEVAVRDGISGFEVIVLVKRSDEVCFVSWQGGESVAYNSVPDAAEIEKILRQRVRLPMEILGYAGERFDDVIKELEIKTLKVFEEWQYVRRLSGELVLLLDENFETELCGYKIKYTLQSGMEYERRKNE